MISYSDALNLITSKAYTPKLKQVPLMQAIGKIAAEDVSSQIQVPGFRNSAMDGFAVMSSQIASASQSSPVTLTVAATIAAGESATISDTAKATQIMTGAAVPEPYDAVVPVELVSIQEGRVTFTAPARHGDNIRLAGEDVTAGQIVLHKGKRITPENIMLLAAVGVATVAVAEAPQLRIISTGNEIIDVIASIAKQSRLDCHVGASAPPRNDGLPDGKIYNSNAPYLLAEAYKQGLDAHYEGIIRDEPELFEAKIKAIKSPAIIISTGAVSKGIWDFIPDSLKKLGADIHFHRVNIRPGKPVLFATMPDGSYYFGLPGNPISAAIGFTFFVMPLIHALQGLTEPSPLMAKLSADFTKRGNFRQYLKSTLSADASGQLIADISNGQESFKISPMAANNAWVILDGEKREYHAGDYVTVVPYGEIIQTNQKKVLLCQAA